MAESAFVGQKPVTADDKLIAGALKALSPSLYNPDPALPLGPPAPSPNAPNDYDGGRIFTLATACLVFIIIITTGRLLIRRFQKKLSFGPDDWVIIPAAITAVAYCCNGYVLLNGGCIGRHMYYCTYANLNYAIEIISVNQSIFYFGVYCAKVSIVLFNRRLTSMTGRHWKITHWVYLAVILSCMVFSIFSVIFTCIPVPAHYNLIPLALAGQNHTLHCLDQQKLQLALRAFHIATDLALLAIPLIVLRQLQLPLRKKIQMGLLFSFGVMTCISSIMRNVVAGQNPVDVTYDSFPLLAWDTIDITFAVIVASLPVYGGYLDRLVTSTYTVMSDNPYLSGSRLKSGGRKFLRPLDHLHSSKASGRTSDCERLDDFEPEKPRADRDVKNARDVHQSDEFELTRVVDKPLPQPQGSMASLQDSLQLPSHNFSTKGMSK